MKIKLHSLCLAALTALSLLASCSSKPKETDANKTAVVVPADVMTTSDSAAVKPDSAK
ncbi:MAG: hypothetical protein ACRYFX_14840 [Janthinobacterium lividum]